MPRIAETAEFIGRIKEVKELIGILEKAKRRKGQIAFIYGEPGIGKSRLIKELSRTPEGSGFCWMSTRCIYHEGTDPYLPFYDAMRECREKTFLEKTQIGPGLVECEGEIISGTKDPTEVSVIGSKLREDPENPFGAFMIKEQVPKLSLKAFTELLSLGYKGLCISRIPPEKLGKIKEYEGSKVLWLSKKTGENCIPPSLTKLSHEIMDFIKEKKGKLILLDGLEYIIGNVEFTKVIKFVNELVDSISIHRGILIMPVDPQTVDPKQLALLQRDMAAVDTTEFGAAHEIKSDGGFGAESEAETNKEYQITGRDRVFENITREITELALVNPAVLFIDDLHWADEGTLHLLHYIARAIKNHSVAVLCAYRPEDLADTKEAHPLLHLINRLTTEKLIDQISLKRLDQNETGEMILSLLGTTKLPGKLDSLIFKETEGNPFFIEEMLRSLEEDNVLRYNEPDGTWSLTKKIPEISIPISIKDVVNTRTDRLEKPIRLMIECASVIGTEFDYDLLAAVTAVDENTLVNNLDDLVRLKLLTELPAAAGQPVTYRFAHNKIREVLFDSLSQSRKRLLHKKTAVAIEEKHKSDLDKFVFELAMHYFLGSDYRRGLFYAMKAGEKALGGFAPEKARTFYLRALESLELIEARPSEVISNKTVQMEILSKLSEIGTIIGEWNEALGYTEELLKISKSMNDAWKQASAHLSMGRILLYRSEWSEAIKNFNRALELSEEARNQTGLMESYYQLGRIHQKMGDYPRAMEFYQQFMEYAVPMESQHDIARGYKAFASVYSRRGEYKKALEYNKQCIKLLTAAGRHDELANAYTNIGIIYYELDDLEKVIESNEKCIEIATKVGNIRLQGYGYSNAAEAYACLNKLDLAEKYAGLAFDIFNKIDEKTMIGLVWMNFGIINKIKKDWKKSRKCFDKSLSILKELNVPYYLADCKHQLGQMLMEQGSESSLAESREFLSAALKMYKELGVEKYIKIINLKLEDTKGSG